MKIAVPTNDKLTVSPHFGRTLGFMVFEVEGKEVKNEEYRENNVTGHAKGQHHEHDHNHHGHQHGNDHAQHSHSGIMNALHDCEVVIAGGMGRRLYVDFEAAKKQVFVTQISNLNEAINAYLSNTIDNNEDACCQH